MRAAFLEQQPQHRTWPDPGGSRDRRTPYANGVSPALAALLVALVAAGAQAAPAQGLDPESLERENDQGIDLIGDKVSELRKVGAAGGGVRRRWLPLRRLTPGRARSSRTASRPRRTPRTPPWTTWRAPTRAVKATLPCQGVTCGLAAGRPDGARTDQPGRGSHALQAGGPAVWGRLPGRTPTSAAQADRARLPAQVFQDPTRRRSCYWMAGAVLALFALYLLGLRYFRSRAQPGQA